MKSVFIMWSIKPLVLFCFLARGHKIIEEQFEDNDVIRCGVNLVQTALPGKDLTLIAKSNEDLPEEIFKLKKNKFINKKIVGWREQTFIYNEAYIVLVEDYDDVLTRSIFLTNDTYWNPAAPIIVMNKNAQVNNVSKVFEIFSNLYAFNLLFIGKIDVINSIPYIFTHDLDSSVSCANISYSIKQFKCNEINDDIFNVITYRREKVHCDTKIVLNGIFPLTFLKTKTEGNEFERKGYENVFFKLSEEFLKIEFKRNYENERVGNVFENFSATGLLKQIKDGKIEGITGGMLLLEQRAKIFDYVYTRFADFYVVVIPKSSKIEKWKAIFLTFNTAVWGLMISLFITFAFFCITLNIFNTKDHIKTFLILFGYYFGFISTYKNRAFSHRLLIFIWCLGAWLFICYFQSVLSSVFTSPGYYHQIETLDEVIDLRFDLYINEVYRNFIGDSLEINFTESFRSLIYCDSMLHCLKDVSVGGKRATITSFLYFRYHEALFLDEFGEPTLYYLLKPFNQMWLTTYLRKGHPNLNNLRLLEMRIIEGGFLAKSFKEVKSITVDTIKGSFTAIKQSDLAGIYYILMSGWSLTFVIFLLEVCKYKY